jgi:diguanylate cyclase (GGDEF)-like protein
LAGITLFLATNLFILIGESAFTAVFSVPTALHTRLIGLALYPLPPLYLRFLRELYPLEARGRASVTIERLLWVWLAVSWIVPLQWWADLLYAGIVVMVGAAILVGTTLARALRSRRDGIGFVVSAISVLIATAVLELGGTAGIVALPERVAGYGFVVFAGFNSLAVFLRIVDFRISLTNLKDQAQHDGLTGLYNRRTLDARVREEHLRHGRSGRPLALIMLDVDNFKPYNDNNGHQAGDRVLKTVATVLHNHARRSGDVAARYGGEEFTLLLPHTDIHDAYRIAESIRRSVEDHKIPHPDSASGVVTVSLGVTVLEPTGGVGFSTDPESLYRAADSALYDAKETGRNGVRTAYVSEAIQAGARVSGAPE